MAKPTVVPTFASSVNYPMDAEPEQGTATKVAPSGAVENYGYRPEAKPKAQNLNYVLYWLSQWAAYVNAGEWDGALHVTGAVDLDLTLNVDGDITAVTNISAGTYYSASTRYQTIHHSKAVSRGAEAYTGTWLLTTTYLDYGLDIESGGNTIITGFTLYVNKTSNAAVTLTAELVEVANTTGVETVLETVSIATNAPGYTTIPSGVFAHSTSVGKSYVIRASRSAVGGSDNSLSLTYNYTKPRP